MPIFWRVSITVLSVGLLIPGIAAQNLKRTSLGSSISPRPALATEAASRYVGNGNFVGVGIAVDADGNAYAAGYGWVPGTINRDLYIYKLNPQFEVVATFTLGGSMDETLRAMVLGADGNLYLTGETQSADYPTVHPVQADLAGVTDAFLTKISTSGDILFSTYYGGSGREGEEVLAVDADGVAYIGARTGSTDFPTTPGAFISQIQSPVPDQLETLVAFKVDTVSGSLVYATGMGGNWQDSFYAAAVAPGGEFYLLHNAASPTDDFPVTDGTRQDQNHHEYLVRLNADGTGITLGTYLDTSSDYYYDAVTGPDGNLRLGAPKLIITLDSATNQEVSRMVLGYSFQKFVLDGDGNILTNTAGGYASPSLGFHLVGADSVMRFRPDGFLQFGTGLPTGASDAGIAAGPNGFIYYLGQSGMVGRVFADPTSPGNYELPPMLGVANSAASTISSHIAPGEIVSLYGSGIGSTEEVTTEIGDDGLVTTELGQVGVRFNGTPGRMLYSGPLQVNVVAPFDLGDSDSVLVEVFHSGDLWASINMNVADSEPVAFPYQFASAALNQDGTVNTKTNRAEPGSIVAVFMSGAGLMGGLRIRTAKCSILRRRSWTCRLPR